MNQRLEGSIMPREQEIKKPTGREIGEAIGGAIGGVADKAVAKVDALKKSADDTFNAIKDGVVGAHRGAVEATVSGMEGLAKAKDATINGANEAIASVSQRIDSFNTEIYKGLAIVKLEGSKYIVEIKDDTGKAVKLAMERTTDAGREVLANVNGKWQYVKDVGGDYADKVTAAAKVAYNNTLKPVGDRVAAVGNAVGRVAADIGREYNQELARNRDASRGTKPTEGSIQDARRLDNSLSTSKEYTIKSGDTLSKIALTEVSGLDKSKAGEYLKQIVAANPLMNPDKIAVGQKINLPKVA